MKKVENHGGYFLEFLSLALDLVGVRGAAGEEDPLRPFEGAEASPESEPVAAAVPLLLPLLAGDRQAEPL